MSLTRVLPALLAGLLVCFLPSCASIPSGLADAAAAKAREESRPARAVSLKPVVEGAPACIQRGAGMDFDPPAPEGELWALLLVYVFAYIGYAIAWSLVALGEVIYDACGGGRSDAPDVDEPRDQYPRAVSPP
jgi:hypothetical protein